MVFTRKSFMTTLGVSGLALGMMVGGAPAALAQDEVATPPAAAAEAAAEAEAAGGPRADHLAQREELYADFTAALAAELGIASGDEVDAAIRAAMMTVIDQQEAEGLLTYGQAEALKILVATSDVPLGPSMMGGHERIGMFRGHFDDKGGREHHILIGRDGHEGHGGMWQEDDDGPAEQGADDATTEDEADASS